MITLSKLNGTSVMVNPDQIRFIEVTPDTVLTFFDGEKLVVREAPKEIVEKIVDYRKICSNPMIIKE